MWDGQVGCGAEILELFPDEEVLEGMLFIRAGHAKRDKGSFAIDQENVTVLPLAQWVVMEGAFIVGDDEW